MYTAISSRRKSVWINCTTNQPDKISSQKIRGGVYAEFLRRQIPFSAKMKGKSQLFMSNLLYTEKSSPETPLFKISGVWERYFLRVDTFYILICCFFLEFPGKWALVMNFFRIDPELFISQQLFFLDLRSPMF